MVLTRRRLALSDGLVPAEALRVPLRRERPVVGVAEGALDRTLQALQLRPQRRMALGREDGDEVHEQRALAARDRMLLAPKCRISVRASSTNASQSGVS